MIDPIISVFLVLIILTAALIIVSRSIFSMIFIYSFQSFLIAIVAIILYFSENNPVLLIIALLTFLSKVLLIPYMTRRVQRDLKIKRDADFHHIGPIGSIFLSILVFFIIYISFSRSASVLADKTFLVVLSLSVSLVFMGMITMFTRKQTITNVIGYLTMENGALLIGLFIAHLPLIIEFLVLVDLIMLISLVTLLAFGIDSSIEAYHAKIDPFNHWFEDEK